jgi:hypothetical protein
MAIQEPSRQALERSGNMKVIFKKVPFLATMTMYCHLTTEMDGGMIHGKTRKEEGCPGTGGTHLIKNGELYSVLMLSVESTGYQLGAVKWELSHWSNELFVGCRCGVRPGV